MTDVLVSVIIPVYNSAETVERALLSVINQTYRNIEIIVVDDGSTDNTNDVLNSYKESITSIKQANQGAGAARNSGVLASGGDYIAFLDADDVWHKSKIEVQVGIFKRHPEIKVCNTQCGPLGKNNKANECDAEGVDNVGFSVEDDFNKFFLDPYLGTPSVMVRKKDFDCVGGFDEGLATAEDIDLWLRLAYPNGVLTVNKVLTEVIGRVGSLTRSKDKSVFEDNIRVIERFCETNQEYYMSNRRTVSQAMAKVYRSYGSFLLREGECFLALRVLKLANKHEINGRGAYLLIKSVLLCTCSSLKSVFSSKS